VLNQRDFDSSAAENRSCVVVLIYVVSSSVLVSRQLSYLVGLMMVVQLI
jgi:hypothetical protein